MRAANKITDWCAGFGRPYAYMDQMVSSWSCLQWVANSCMTCVLMGSERVGLKVLNTSVVSPDLAMFCWPRIESASFIVGVDTSAPSNLIEVI